MLPLAQMAAGCTEAEMLAPEAAANYLYLPPASHVTS